MFPEEPRLGLLMFEKLVTGWPVGRTLAGFGREAASGPLGTVPPALRKGWAGMGAHLPRAGDPLRAGGREGCPFLGGAEDVHPGAELPVAPARVGRSRLWWDGSFLSWLVDLLARSRFPALAASGGRAAGSATSLQVLTLGTWLISPGPPALSPVCTCAASCFLFRPDPSVSEVPL